MQRGTVAAKTESQGGNGKRKAQPMGPSLWAFNSVVLFSGRYNQILLFALVALGVFCEAVFIGAFCAVRKFLPSEPRWL